MNPYLTKEEILNQLRRELKRENYPPLRHPGGQHVGVTIPGVSLTCSTYHIQIRVWHHKSQIKNLQVAMELMELAWMEIMNYE